VSRIDALLDDDDDSSDSDSDNSKGTGNTRYQQPSTRTKTAGEAPHHQGGGGGWRRGSFSSPAVDLAPQKPKNEMAISSNNNRPSVVDLLRNEAGISCRLNNPQVMALYLMSFYESIISVSIETCFIDYDDLGEEHFIAELKRARAALGGPDAWAEMASVLYMLAYPLPRAGTSDSMTPDPRPPARTASKSDAEMSAEFRDHAKRIQANGLIKTMCLCMKKWRETPDGKKRIDESRTQPLHQRIPYIRAIGTSGDDTHATTNRGATAPPGNPRDDNPRSIQSSSTPRLCLELVRPIKKKEAEIVYGDVTPNGKNEVIQLPWSVFAPAVLGLSADLMNFVFIFGLEPDSSFISPRTPIGLCNIIKIYLALHTYDTGIIQAATARSASTPPSRSPVASLSHSIQEAINQYMNRQRRGTYPFNSWMPGAVFAICLGIMDSNMLASFFENSLEIKPITKYHQQTFPAFHRQTNIYSP